MKNYFSDLPLQSHVLPDIPADKPLPSADQPMPMPTTPEAAVVLSASEITKEAIRCFTDYAKCKEQEITERQRISAALRAIELQINTQKDVYLKELDRQYEERRQLYDLATTTHEKALELGDKEMLQLCYSFILDIYSQPVGSRGVPSSLLSSPIGSAGSF